MRWWHTIDRNDEGRKLFSRLDDVGMEMKWDRDDAWKVDEALDLYEKQDGDYT